MPRIASSGKCRLCGAAFGKAALGRHLAACVATSVSTQPTGAGKRSRPPFFHVIVEGRYAPYYWLHLAVPPEATLVDLDSVLRRIWLECCGHMSAFEIAGTRYSQSPWGRMGAMEDEKAMEAPIGKVLQPGDQFTYEYDFGSTTCLKGRVLAGLLPAFPKRKIQLLARNEPPDLRCAQCEKPATQVCSQCFWEGAGTLCDACAEKHECGEEMLLTAVNSPRLGVCGYCGPSKEP